MNPDQITKEVENNEVNLIDVREDYEFEEGHISGAKNVPLGTICEDNLKDFPKDKPVYVYCRSGARAENAKNMLQDLDFKNVTNIGGIVQWQENGGSLVK